MLKLRLSVCLCQALLWLLRRSCFSLVFSSPVYGFSVRSCGYYYILFTSFFYYFLVALFTPVFYKLSYETLICVLYENA